MPLANHAPAVVLIRRYREHYAPIIPKIKELRRAGLSLNEVAEILNNKSFRNIRGTAFTKQNLDWLINHSTLRGEFAA
jgi:DNA-binding transcriptional MerR regulator